MLWSRSLGSGAIPDMSVTSQAILVPGPPNHVLLLFKISSTVSQNAPDLITKSVPDAHAPHVNQPLLLFLGAAVLAASVLWVKRGW